MEKLTFKVCDYCHGKMLPQTMSQTFQFNGKELKAFRVTDVKTAEMKSMKQKKFE